MNDVPSYVSFLVRFWANPAPHDQGRASAWQAEVESIQTGDTRRFTNFADLLAFFESATPGGQTDKEHFAG